MTRSLDSFGTRGTVAVGGRSFGVYRLDALPSRAGVDISGLPFSLKILLENLLRHEDGQSVTPESIEALASWAARPGGPGGKADGAANGSASGERVQIAFSPARILLQDFTGVPVVADLAAMRDAMVALGGDPRAVQPQVPAELVIDHSIIADVSGRPDAFVRNAELEFERNRERYRFLRWGQQAFGTLSVVPPNTGICHQVNLEYLARVVFATPDGEAYPDTMLGTDSHTTMVNGLGVLGWGVGGIEAEVAMLGEPVTMLIPDVVGFRLTGALPEGATATDLVLTVAELLRRHGVVGKFVEFYGEGVAKVPVYNRATIGNMSPEYGSTCAIFPVDDETLRYLRFTGRSEEQVNLVEAYAKDQGLWLEPTAEPAYSERVELDLSSVEPSIAGPSRPQDRVPLKRAKAAFGESLAKVMSGQGDEGGSRVAVKSERGGYDIGNGAVVIAAITSCTNTSNPDVMVAAGLVAKRAVERGLAVQPWVKTSLAPGSKVVIDYYERSGLQPYLDKLGFSLVGYGCTTCIGNSGPLLPGVSEAVNEGGLAVVAVLSGNRNFEGRIHPDVRMNYLASPPLVVAYALAGSMDFDITREPLGTGTDGRPVYLADIWPSTEEIAAVVHEAIAADMFEKNYAEVFAGDENWSTLDVPRGELYEWEPSSTYVRQPPYFDGMPAEPAPLADIQGARALASLGDSVTTDHISPAGSIRRDSPAGAWLVERGVTPAEFNSYGSRRGNHEVMVRGTFANIRLRNALAPGTEGGFTTVFLAGSPTGEHATVYDAAMRYAAASTPLVVLAGKEYGSGSSRDWAAKGPALLGVRAVIAESFERIHRSNLIGMGILPLQFLPGDSVASLGLTGEETFDITGLEAARDGKLPERLAVRAGDKSFEALLRIDTPVEADYFRHGGILPYVLRRLRQRTVG